MLKQSLSGEFEVVDTKLSILNSGRAQSSEVLGLHALYNLSSQSRGASYIILLSSFDVKKKKFKTFGSQQLKALQLIDVRIHFVQRDTQQLSLRALSLLHSTEHQTSELDV